MKKILIYFLFCILLFNIFNPCYVYSSENKLKVAFRIDPPYQYVDDKGNVIGLHVDFLNAVAKAQGYLYSPVTRFELYPLMS